MSLQRLIEEEKIRKEYQENLALNKLEENKIPRIQVPCIETLEHKTYHKNLKYNDLGFKKGEQYVINSKPLRCVEIYTNHILFESRRGIKTSYMKIDLLEVKEDIVDYVVNNIERITGRCMG